MRRISLLLLFLFLLAPEARSQCPDGMPPPCLGARRAQPRRPLPDSATRARSFVLLPFRNIARVEAQDWLVTGSPLMLADALGQYRDLRVVPDEQLAAARRRLGFSDAVNPDASQLRRLAEETGGWTAITGNIIVTGGRLRIAAVALDAATGQVLSRASVDAAENDDVRAAYEQLAGQLLQVTAVRSSIEGLAARTTTSLDAYRAFVRGTGYLLQASFRQADAEFLEAVRLDSMFGLAWASLARSSAGWNLANLVNPTSISYRASARAAALVPRLPPRVAAMVRAQSAFFGGDIAGARRVGDSLIAADPDDLDMREFMAMIEMLDPRMDTLSERPRALASPNRSVALAREVIERDPGRRYVYSIFGYYYGLAAGMWGGSMPGTRNTATSYAMLLLGANEPFFPVLRESFAVMPQAAYQALPDSVRVQSRRRAADAGAAWMQRWLAAGPEDAEAWLWASRLAEQQDSLAQALRYAERGDSLGAASEIESVKGRRMMLLMRLARYVEAGALADSLAAAGQLRRPFIALIDRGFAYGTAALLVTGRFSRAAAVVAQYPPIGGRFQCQPLVQDFGPGVSTSLSEEVVRAVMFSVSRRVGEVAASPVLRPCLLPLLTGRRWPGETGRTVGQRLLGIADSIAAAGDSVAAFNVGLAAWWADEEVGARLQGKPWFASRERLAAVGSRFLPSAAFVHADSVTFAWELKEPGAFAWDMPELSGGWSMIVRMQAPAPDSQVYTVEIGHVTQPREAPATGGVAELVQSITNRAVVALYRVPPLTQVSGSAASTETGFRVVVRGDLVRELRRIRVASAAFSWRPCLRWETRGRDCPSVSLPIEYR